ncbi:DUF2795 domain-containing protein [Streptomyces sp. DSM 44917]|uniref:DUF2795 domain-containing protein n=1 Tax=Streptomyces boetiae TaxID=3075541 RepID=A0ABU2LBI0_9ACTN|nr:DUF2795 domain-containing protein [Streptomyces sp. DSM 44917]MDT0308850.1 DUF2795 domain-containing protein [Streptomyces sp. DSM 44917]
MGKTNPIEVQKALKNAGYPSDKQALMKTARKNGADKSLVQEIGSLRQDRFDGPNDVEKAIFGH